MPCLYTNDAKSTLASGILAGATSFSVQAGDGALFPNPGGGDFFYVTLVEGSTKEQVKCTARSTDTITCEATTNAFSTGARVEIRVNKELLDSLYYARLSGGVDANFTAMPQVGGSPIVQSDSNSDGYWVRYADGTQDSYKLLTCEYATENILEKTWTYPRSFNAVPSIKLTAHDYRLITPNATYPSETNAENFSELCRTISSTNSVVRFTSGVTTFIAGNTAFVMAFAKGIWA